MKCAECVAEGERSTITPLGGYTNLLGWSPFYDEDGVYHSHDPNKHVSMYHCSRGHMWEKVTYAACGSCDYAKRREV